MKYEVVAVAVALVIFVGAFVLIVSSQNKSKKTDALTVKISPTPSRALPIESNQLSDVSPEASPTTAFDISKTYIVTLKTTEGDIAIEMKAPETPKTVQNFVTLAKKNFYNNTIFHRIIKGFMIQGGDPTGTGRGGPGYTFKDEPFEGEYTRGTVAMANAGPNTNGSQFFIMHQDYQLPKNYVIFGKVTSGLEAVDKIAEASVAESESGEPSKPVKPVKIISVEVVEK